MFSQFVKVCQSELSRLPQHVNCRQSYEMSSQPQGSGLGAAAASLGESAPVMVASSGRQTPQPRLTLTGLGLLGPLGLLSADSFSFLWRGLAGLRLDSLLGI